MASNDSAEQAGITRQATQGHMILDIIGKMATRANVRTVVLSHLARGPMAPTITRRGLRR